MQTRRAGNMRNLQPEKGILGHNYSLALLRMKIWPVTFGSTMIKKKNHLTPVHKIQTVCG